MKLQKEIEIKKDMFLEMCQNHSVKTLYAFGSSVTDRFNEKTSDIDVLVEIDEPDPIERGEKLISFWDKMEEFFDRKVDLLTDSSLTNPVLRKNIDNTKILIYDGRRQKVFI